MSQPSPKGQLIQILLIGATIFLGMQLLFPKRASDSRSSAEILKSMRTMNAKVLDRSITNEKSALDGKLSEEVEKKVITPAAAKRLGIEGTILVADTQFRGGIVKSEFQRVNSAYLTLQSLERSMQGDQLWTSTSYDLVPNSVFKDSSTTGHELYGRIVDDLSRRSKTDLVFGLVPGFAVIDALVASTGRIPAVSYWVAALILAAIVRLTVFPLAQKQYMFGRQMGQLSPLLAEIKEQYTDKKTKQLTNQQEYQARTMELYQKYGINPMAGCFPALIQIPFFLLIYNCMLHYQFEFQKGTFAWINSSFSASTNGFIAPNLGQKDTILIIIYGISMVATAMLAPMSTSDPAQAKQQKMISVGMSGVFAIIMFFWPLPSAFVLYWVFLNIFATAHMLYAYRLPPPPLQEVNAPGGGVFPFGPKHQAGAVQVPSSSRPTKGTGTPVKHRPKKK